MQSCKASFQTHTDDVGMSPSELLTEIARLRTELGEKERLHRIEMEVHQRISSIQVDILRQENTDLVSALELYAQQAIS